MIPFAEFELSPSQIERIKQDNKRNGIREYIKENNVEPDSATAESFYTISEEDIEKYRRIYYSLLMCGNYHYHNDDDSPHQGDDEPIIDSGSTVDSGSTEDSGNTIDDGSSVESGETTEEMWERIKNKMVESKWIEIPAMDDDELIYLYHPYDYGNSNDEWDDRNYSFAYNPNLHLSKWVAYPLNRQYIGSGSRTNAWGFDPFLPMDMQPDLTGGSYGGGYIREHLIASADRLNYMNNIETFYSSVIVPNDYDVGGYEWADIEGTVRGIAASNDISYVVAGVIVDENSDMTGLNSGFSVPVPDYLYKVVLSSKRNQWKTYCALLNRKTREIQYLSISELESITGMCYFPNLKDIVGAEQYNEIKAQPSET